MRCTKCHYLSFEPEPRCRNCGHDLSLEEGSPFSLFDAAMDGRSEASEPGRAATALLAPPRTASAPATSRISTAELPLFVRSMQGAPDSDGPAGHQAQGAHDAHDAHHVHEDVGLEDLEPLVRVPARPRTPVSVRRATPDPARLRAKYGLSPNPEPDLWSNIPPDPIDSVDLHGAGGAFQDLPLTSAASKSWQPTESASQRLPVGWQGQEQEVAEETVGAGTRLASASIDATILVAISAVVIYLTLRVTGLSLVQVGLLPALPMAGLLLLITVGYFVMFSLASGQTVGKMAMNIKVVGSRLVRL